MSAPKILAPHKCMEVLGNPLRTKIIELLLEKPRTVQELCTELKKEQSLVSHSLTQLRECNFVTFTKQGKQSVYNVKSDIFSKKKPIFEAFKEHAEKHCAAGCK